MWILGIASGIILLALFLLPSEKDKLDFLQKRIDETQEQQKLLNEKEKELVEKAFQKEWEKLDKETDK